MLVTDMYGLLFSPSPRAELDLQRSVLSVSIIPRLLARLIIDDMDMPHPALSRTKSVSMSAVA